MNRFDPQSIATASASFGGAILAQVSQSPQVTAGMILLALIGLASMLLRYLQARLELDVTARDLRARAAELEAELRILRRLGRPDETPPT